MDNDFFQSEARKGHTFTQLMAARLNNRGVRCRATDLEFAKDIADRQRFVNEQDIVFDWSEDCIEVKSRDLWFTEDPNTFPFETAFVDTVQGWDKKTPEPLAVLVVSQREPHHCLVIPRASKKSWTVRRAFDQKRGYSDDFYQINRTSLAPFDALVDWLLRRQPQEGN